MNDTKIPNLDLEDKIRFKDSLWVSLETARILESKLVEAHDNIEMLKNALLNERENSRAGGIEMEEQRKRILKELEQKYRIATQLSEENEEKIKANKKILDQSRIG